MANNELKHHGILGMKWGVRRYQNKDGTLTDAGKRRAAKLESQYNELTGERPRGSSKGTSQSQDSKKKLSDLTDDELKSRVNRLQSEKMYLDLEKQIKALQPEQVSRGKKFFQRIANDVVAPAAIESGKRLLADLINKQGREVLGLNSQDTDPTKALKKEVESLNLKKQKKELDKYFEREAEKEKQKKNTESKRTEEKQKNKQESNESKSSDESTAEEKPPTMSGTVVGEGTSRRSSNERRSSSRSNSTIIDAEFVDITEDNVNRGRTYALALLEEKN